MVCGMGRKQKNLLRTRYMTDIISRWKTGVYVSELNDKLEEYRKVAEISDEEHRAFVKEFKSQMYSIQIEEYKEELLHKRVRFKELPHYVRQDVPYVSVQKKLMKQINVWIAAENDTIYHAILAKYLNLLTHGSTPDELYNRVEDDTNNEAVQERLWDSIEEWERTLQDSQRPANELGRMAQDAQNIHTLAVSRQTNTMMDILAKVSVPSGQRTMAEILGVWSSIVKKEIVATVEMDMREWANKSYVVNEGDFLYRKTLRSVWAKIQLYPEAIRGELTRRLWEECSDAVGMCAQGHVSRLLNVFVGFDDAAVVEESFQDRMAAISRMDIDSQAKITEATRVMDAIHMDESERQPWLEAF